MIGLAIGLITALSGVFLLVVAFNWKHGAAPVLGMIAGSCFISGFLMMAAAQSDDTPEARADNARATIAAATAAVASGTAESELAALEREASVAATAAASEGVER